MKNGENAHFFQAVLLKERSGDGPGPTWEKQTVISEFTLI